MSLRCREVISDESGKGESSTGLSWLVEYDAEPVLFLFPEPCGDFSSKLGWLVLAVFRQAVDRYPEEVAYCLGLDGAGWEVPHLPGDVGGLCCPFPQGGGAGRRLHSGGYRCAFHHSDCVVRTPEVRVQLFQALVSQVPGSGGYFMYGLSPVAFTGIHEVSDEFLRCFVRVVTQICFQLANFAQLGVQPLPFNLRP